MIEYNLLIIAFLIGILTKITDLIVDDKIKFIKYSEYLFWIIYGILTAYIIINTNEIVASLWMGLVIGVVLTKKIDKFAHILGLVSFIFYISISGLPQLNSIYLIIFTIATTSDEIIEEKIKNKEKMHNLLKKFFALELVSLIVSLITGVWMVFLSILFFDIAYIIISKIGIKIKHKK